jgi:hypothetical protein
MNRVEAFVLLLSDDDKKRIIFESKEFERDGHIGDCYLRRSARDLMIGMGIYGDSNIVLWMNQLTNETYKFFAERYLRMEWIKALDNE